jgi:uncharacterized protein YjbI with pentapeptide repeats
MQPVPITPGAFQCLESAWQALSEGAADEAVAWVQEHLRREPTDAVAHATLGMALCQMGETRSALEAMERAHYIDPRDPRILFNYALVLEASGRPEEARIRYYSALRLRPGYRRALDRLAGIGGVGSQIATDAGPQSDEPFYTDELAMDAGGARPRTEPAGFTAALPGHWAGFRRLSALGYGGAGRTRATARRSAVAAAVVLALAACTALFAASGSMRRDHTAGAAMGSTAAPAAGGSLEGARLAGSSFPGMNFDGANLRRANLERGNLRGASFVRADLRQARLAQAVFLGADLRQARLDAANLLGANLWKADMQGALAPNAYLKAAKLAYANLSAVDLRGSNLSHADLSHATLREADLSAASLQNVDLTGADLRDAKLNGTDLRFSHLHNAQFEGATYSTTTRWPPGVDVAQLGMLIATPGGR